MIIRKEDKVEIYENKKKYKIYFVILSILAILLVIVRILLRSQTIILIEIVTYCVLIISLLITYNNIKKTAKKQLEIDKNYLTIYNAKTGEVKERVITKDIKEIRIPLITFGDAFVLYVKNKEIVLILRRYANIKLKEFRMLIEEFKNK